MKIIDNIKNKKPVISFEVFPPKKTVPLDKLFNSLSQFSLMKPDYISVTYGAGGSQKDRTIEIASKIKNHYKIESMAHFTCVGHSKEEIDLLLDDLRKNDLENILALRGDPPADDPDFDFNKNAFKYASDLIKYIRSNSDFCIAAAAYLEGHVESKNINEDLIHLKNKCDMGVDFLVTQLFFDNRLYYDFIDKAISRNINCPIIPGIMPVFKADQIKTMCFRSGCSIPAKLVLMMDKYSDKPEELLEAGIEYASKQIRDLIDNSAPGIHLYTMNRHISTRKILENAGLL